MDFVSIDFETANEKRNSACSIGITVVENNKIIEERYWLIKPYEMRFVPMNVWIHGIVEEDVENEPNMDKLWKEIKPYLQNRFVVAHNASFDISVLRSTLDVYGISYPEFMYSCTMIMAKNYYKDLANYKLNTVAKHIGVKFKHHHASADATAAAKILIEISEGLNVDTIEELSSKLELKIGKVYKGGYSSAGSYKVNSRRASTVSPQNINPEWEESRNSKLWKIELNNNAFLNNTVVFTGPLESMSRIEAMKRVICFGGNASSSVTRKTNYLVTGIRNFKKISFDKKSTKLKKAEMLIEKGQDIKIIGEDEFLKMIKNGQNQ